jgi:hypothetical protein
MPDLLQQRAWRSAAMKASWAKPKVRARRITAIKAAWSNPVVRARCSAAVKAFLAAQKRLRMVRNA